MGLILKCGLKAQNFALLPALLGVICVGASAQEVDPSKKVRDAFQATYAEQCPADMMSKLDTVPQTFETTFNYGDEDYPPRPYMLYRIHCTYGAYNESAIYYGLDDYDELHPIQFAVPEFEVVYENGDIYASVERVDHLGFTVQDLIINSSVDPETLTISSFSKWRGMGDASSVGIWRFSDGRFVLQSYDVDGSYDSKVNPTRIYGEGEPDYGE